jgi:hypothetical protein
MLRFDDATHTYWLGSERIPGVTTILKPLNDFSRIDPAVLAAAAARGTAAHLATELDDEGDLDEASVHETVRPYLDAWRLFKRDTGAVVISSEQRVFHSFHKYAGTLDRVLSIDGDKYLIDLKTSVQISPATGPQTSAYLAALGDATVIRRGVVQLKADGSYKFVKLGDPNDLAVFLSCLTVHRFLEKTA